MMMGWGAGGDWHAPNMGRTFGWENILGFSPRGKDRGDRQTDKNRQIHKGFDIKSVRCTSPRNKIIHRIWLKTVQTDKWVTAKAKNERACREKSGLNKNLSLGYSSLKSLPFLVVQSRTFSSLMAISFPCQRPCHNYRRETKKSESLIHH